MSDNLKPLTANAERIFELLTLAQATAQLGAWEFDVATNCVSWTDATYRIHETTSGEFTPSVIRVLRFFAPQTGAVIRQSLTAAVQQGVSFDLEVQMTTARGRLVWVRLCGVPKLQEGRTVRVAGAIQDITSHKQTSARLELLVKSVAHLNDTVLITEDNPINVPGPIIVFINEAFTRMTGYSSAEVLGRNPRFLQGPKTSRPELDRLRKALERHMPVRVEFINYHKDGSEFIVEMDVVPISNQQGRCTHWVSVQRNVTARKQAEATAALREAQRIESLGTLASGIAHDFNNILTAILGNVAIAQADAHDATVVEASLEQINRAGFRARGLIQRILAYSRRQPEAFLHQPLNAIVLEACELVRSALPAGVRLEMSVSDTPLLVMADSSQLLQVLLNLTTNACHAVGNGQGRVVVTVAKVTKPIADDALEDAHNGRISTAALGEQSTQEVKIEVADDGIGMDEATVLRVFEPYFTTKPFGQGTGLGLAVVWGIVAAHRGRITIDSRLGQGTVVSVFLPLCDAEQAQPRPRLVPSTPVAMHTAGQHVLVLDDDDVVGITLQALLERIGYRVSLFNDPIAAIAEVQRMPTAFDVVVTDFNMPVLSGVDVTRAILEIRPDLPVLLGSGYLSEDVITAAQHAGVAHVFNKEFAVERLSGLLTQVLTANN